jgi:hypothetical protein
VSDRLHRVDDHATATKGEIRSLERRVEVLEKLREQVSDLKNQVEGIGTGVEQHIKHAIPSAVRAALEIELRPYGDKFDKLDRVLEILIEQETRAKIKAETAAAEEVSKAARTAERDHKLKVWAIAAGIIVPVVVAVTAMINSQIRGSSPTQQSAPK